MESNELLNEFIQEAKGHSATIETGLLRLEESADDDDTVNGLFRAAHSIKGTAGFFGLSKIVELAHAMEALFGEFREHRLKADAGMIDALLAAVDTLKELMDNISVNDDYDVTGHVAALRGFVADGGPKPAGGLSAWDLWNMLTSGEEATAAQTAPVPEVSLPTAPTAAPRPEPERGEDKVRRIVIDDSVRINVTLLNTLLNIAGEMVLRRNQLLRIAQELSGREPLLEVVSKGIDELTTNLQKTVMKTRMQPIASVFNKFPRIVRDLSRKVGKEVDLSMQGLEVELDRSLVEALVDPMTHLIRNALDHGIEPADKRSACGKAPTGSLVLKAYHESGRVVIEVSDDGAGIDLGKVKAKAVQRGLIGEKEAALMREDDILQLILSPGFSTAEKVTDISGRGVGLDVVQTNIEKLGGKVEIITEPGLGTTFRLILPLTLAIISAFIVLAGGQSFAVPQANVRELLLVQPGEDGGKRAEMVHDRPVLRLRGRLLPLVRLSDLLNRTKQYEPSQAADYFLADRTLRILVIKAGNNTYGLAVDSVYDTEEILVKPLPPSLKDCGIYSGVTVLGDGSIAMIVDTESLRLTAGLTFGNDTQQPAELPPAVKPLDAEKQYLLLFRSSGGEMLGLDLALVARVEEVDISRLQKVGAKLYFSFQGQTTRVIRPEHYLPISRRKHSLTKLYIILPKLVKYPIGIIAEEICDAVYATVTLDQGGVAGKGILGSAQINGNIVTLLNMHELFAEAAPEYYRKTAVRKRAEGSAAQVEEGSKQRILLAEDQPFFLRVIKSYLESDGYEVLTAENGREALTLLSQTKVDVVVSDIEMPLMNGLELVRAIRADAALRELPVIAVTSLTGETNKEKGLRAGFDLYEYKLDRTRLLDRIHEVLSKRA